MHDTCSVVLSFKEILKKTILEMQKLFQVTFRTDRSSIFESLFFKQPKDFRRGKVRSISAFFSFIFRLLDLLPRIPIMQRIISSVPLQCDHYAPIMTVHSGSTKRDCNAPPDLPRICPIATMGMRCATPCEASRDTYNDAREERRSSCIKKGKEIKDENVYSYVSN